MDNESGSNNVVIETLKKESAKDKCVQSEVKHLEILIPIFCDLYSESYNAKFIAEMIVRQYLFETSIDDITEIIIEYYKTGKI